MLSWFGQATVLLCGGFEDLNVFIRWMGPWLFFSPLSSMPRIDARSIAGNDNINAHEISRQKTSFIGSRGFSKFGIIFAIDFSAVVGLHPVSTHVGLLVLPAASCADQIFYTRQISLI